MGGSGFLIGFLLSFGLVIWVLARAGNVGEISDVEDGPRDSDRECEAGLREDVDPVRYVDGCPDVDEPHATTKVERSRSNTADRVALETPQSIREADSQHADGRVKSTSSADGI